MRATQFADPRQLVLFRLLECCAVDNCLKRQVLGQPVPGRTMKIVLRTSIRRSCLLADDGNWNAAT